MQTFGFIIPIYMHGATLDALIQGIKGFGFPIILVDDGNPKAIKEQILVAAKKAQNTYIIKIEHNMGKGEALTRGMQKAKELGITHAFQIDADLQHDISYCNTFFALSRANPSSIICGYPIYDKSVPCSRKNCRKLANFWVHINSLCFCAKDSMCGFRIYVVEKYLQVNQKYHLAKRMRVDCQVLICSSWQNVPIVSAPVPVTYPKDGVSNYKAFIDTVGLIFMFFQTFFQMLIFLPAILARRLSSKKKKKSLKVTKS